MAITPREVPEYGGFEIPSEGWHMMVVQEGIDFAKDKDGNIVYSEFTNPPSKSVVVNLAVQGGDEDGRKVSQWCAYQQGSGEQRLADLLGVTGLWKKFEAKFPGLGDKISLFDPKVLQAIQIRLPGMFAKVKVVHGAPNKDGNVKAKIKSMAHVSVDTSKLEGKGGKPVAAPAVTKAPEQPPVEEAAKTSAPSDDWD